MNTNIPTASEMLPNGFFFNFIGELKYEKKTSAKRSLCQSSGNCTGKVALTSVYSKMDLVISNYASDILVLPLLPATHITMCLPTFTNLFYSSFMTQSQSNGVQKHRQHLNFCHLNLKMVKINHTMNKLPPIP